MSIRFGFCKSCEIAATVAVVCLAACAVASAGPVELGSVASAGRFVLSFDAKPASKAWTNGETIPGVYAFRDGAAITNRYTTGGRATNGGIYSVTNGLREYVAIGLLAPQKAEILLAVAFTNNTSCTYFARQMRYAVSQWGFRNRVSQTLETQISVVPEWGDTGFAAPPTAEEWIGSPDWNFITDTADPWPTAPLREEFSPALPRTKIPPGAMFLVAWRMKGPAEGSSAVVAVERLEIDFAVYSNGLRIRLR